MLHSTLGFPPPPRRCGWTPQHGDEDLHRPNRADLGIGDRHRLATEIHEQLLAGPVGLGITKSRRLRQGPGPGRFAEPGILKPSGFAALYSCQSRNKVTPLRRISACTVGQSGTGRWSLGMSGGGGNKQASRSRSDNAADTGPH